MENAEYVAQLKPLLSIRGEEPLDEEVDPSSRLREYMNSKRRLVAKKLCYAKRTHSSWPLKQRCMGDLSQQKEDLEQKITTWQREEDLKLMKSVSGAHVRTPEEDELSEEYVCEPPRECLCCHRPPVKVERDLLYAYKGLKHTTKDEETVEVQLLVSITQGASNLHSDEDMEDKIKLLDPRVQKLIRSYLDGVRGTTNTLDTLTDWNPTHTIAQHARWPTRSPATQQLATVPKQTEVLEAVRRGLVPTAVYTLLRTHAEDPQATAAHMQRTATTKTAEQLTYRTHRYLQHAATLPQTDQAHLLFYQP